MDLEGRVVDEAGLRRRVFHSGCDPRVRREVWKVLLDCWPPNLTQPEREALGEQRAEEYHRIKRQWMVRTILHPQPTCTWGTN